LNPWTANRAHYERITLNRRLELQKMKEYLESRECLMAFLARELSDDQTRACGCCANCSTPTLPDRVCDQAVLKAARQFLRNDFQIIAPRHQWPEEVQLGTGRNIPVHLQNQEGRSLSIYDDPGWGKLVAQGKYRDKRFNEVLVHAAAELILQKWKPAPFPRFVTAVPSLRAVNLVEDFALRLASMLKIPYYQVINKTRETPPQKRMANSAYQAKNVIGAFAVAGTVPPGPCLLVDDIFDSKWTLTVLGYMISEAGGGPVFPFTLARAADRKTLE
jgi:ATP-dependent DNA helicase RecQ